MDIQIICDGGRSVGYGHIKRCLALADTLRKRGRSVHVQGISESAKELLLDIQKECIARSRILVVDSPSNVDDQIELAREQGQRIVALDYLGEAKPDVLINIYPHAKKSAVLKCYTGFEYQIIREEIYNQPRCSQGKGVVVIIGGGDVKGESARAAQVLGRLGYGVTIIKGPTALEMSSSRPSNVLINPKDLPKLLSSCEWVITNGGGCMFEALYLGKPAVVLPQTNAEYAVASSIFKLGGILGLGLSSIKKYSKDELVKVSKAGVSLIDGKGADRIVDIIEELL